MANVAGNPTVVDTPHATNQVLTGRVRILGIRWVGAGTAGDLAVVQDSAGAVIWRSVATGANNIEADTLESAKLRNGVVVPTLSSGTLYIEHG